MENDEGWIVLSGCNQCINSHLCKEVGNCVLLSVDSKLEKNTKKKRLLIQRLRNNSMSKDTRRLYVSWISDNSILAPIQQEAWNKEYGQQQVKESGIRLTTLERMFIDNLNNRTKYDE